MYTNLVDDTAWQTRQHCELLGFCRYKKLVDDAEALTYHVLPALQAERTSAAYQVALGPPPPPPPVALCLLCPLTLSVADTLIVFV